MHKMLWEMTDLLVEVIVMAPVNAHPYMLRHSNSNTSVRHHKVTEFGREMQDSLLSLHIMTACDTTSF